ncbi:MAG: class I SAM-dependent methyltransferase [Sterolibacterium sp.]|nr:class I SAM-dependent methyltransferase [Sterolibacterium sp.]
MADTCPVCSSANTQEFLRRTNQPVHQNLVFATRDTAQRVKRGDLILTLCADCGFIFNAAFDGAKLDYGADYDNTQSHSPYFSRHMKELAQHLIHKESVRGCRIVEVGCGKGDFLRMLVEDVASGNVGIGFDPSYVGPDSDLGGRLQFRRSFYDASCADEAEANIVVCRHVIEHVPQPLEILRAVHGALGKTKAARIYFETPCVAWILREKVIWDFFYEHCSLFTAASLATAFKRCGFVVRAVRHVFGGQYLWLEAGLDGAAADIPEENLLQLAQDYARAEARLREEWLVRLDELRHSGKVAIWGAGAKGSTFANLIDPECVLIDCLVDLNPNKQGKFVPGSAHPIVGVTDLAARGIRTAILMNPNYRGENEALLAAAGLHVQLIE